MHFPTSKRHPIITSLAAVLTCFGCSSSPDDGGISAPVDFDGYYSKYFALGCEKSFDCCLGGGDDAIIGRNWQTGVTTRTGCKSAPGPEVLQEDRESMRSSMKAGRLVFHGESAGACIAALTGYSCRAFYNDRVDPAPCVEMWEGKLALGATCDLSEECPRGAACIGSTSAGYTCRRIPSKGEPCTGYCPSGLYCDLDSSTPTCVPDKPPGSPCNVSRLECDGICDYTTKTCIAITHTPACIGR